MARRLAALLAVLLGVAAPAWALTTYYVDPDFGGSPTGAAATPWVSLTASAWTTINGTLATDNVTVYFSARNAGSDTNEATTTQILLDRTDASTHRLTLDGMSQYNTNDAAPSWAAYAGASRFQITAGGTAPVTTDNTNGAGGPWPDRNYITVQGFKLITTTGQCAVLEGMHNFIFQQNDLSATSAATGPGPCISMGIPYVTNAGVTGGTWPTHVQILNNTVTNTFGECYYVGGSTPDPPGLGTNLQTGDDYLIQGNTGTDCGKWGGEGDGMDVKDGNTNVRVIGNSYKWTQAATNTANGLDLESCTLVDGNYIELPPTQGIATNASWNNTAGRGACVIRNNVVVNVTSAQGARHHCIQLSEATSTTYQWTGTKVYNNSCFKTAADASGDCIHIYSPESGVVVENNILSNCGANGIGNDGAGGLGTHDYNEFFTITSNAVSDNGANTTCVNIANVEAHSLCSDPKYVNTSAPYADVNFKTQAGSPARGAGLNLSGTFADDYTGATRAAPWDIGAFQAVVASPGCCGTLGTGVPSHLMVRYHDGCEALALSCCGKDGLSCDDSSDF